MNYNYLFKSIHSFAFRSFVPLFSDGTFSGPFHSQGKHRDGASTLPRTQSKTCSTSALPVTPSITVSPAHNLDFPSTLSAGRPKLSGSPQLSASDPSPLDAPLSSTLPVPTLRLSPSPTSGCQGTYVDASGSRQPSPIARERRARSISITNTNIEPASSREKSVRERENDVFESLKDVPHPALRGDSSRTYSHRQAAPTTNSFLLHQKVDLVKNESSNLHQSKIPPRKICLRTTLQPNLNLKQQLEFLPNAATSVQASAPEGIPPTDVQRKSQLPFDARPIHPDRNPRGTHRTAQSAGFGSKEPLQDHLCAGRDADLAAPPLGPDSTERLWSRSTGPSRRRQFSFNTAGNTDAPLQRPWDENTTVIPGAGPSSRPPQQPCAAQNKTPPHTHRWRPRKENTNSRMNMESVSNESGGAVEDRCFQAKRQARRDSCSGQTELRLESPDQQHGVFTPCNQNMHVGPNKSHAVLTLSDMELNQKAEGPAELPECSSQSRVKNWPLSVEQRSHMQKGSGNASNGAFGSLLQPQQGVDQRAADTTPTASSLPRRPYYRCSDRVIFLEEDPYYVTMYHPGSVYVGE